MLPHISYGFKKNDLGLMNYVFLIKFDNNGNYQKLPPHLSHFWHPLYHINDPTTYLWRRQASKIQSDKLQLSQGKPEILRWLQIFEYQ